MVNSIQVNCGEVHCLLVLVNICDISICFDELNLKKLHILLLYNLQRLLNKRQNPNLDCILTENFN